MILFEMIVQTNLFGLGLVLLSGVAGGIGIGIWMSRRDQKRLSGVARVHRLRAKREWDA